MIRLHPYTLLGAALAGFFAVNLAQAGTIQIPIHSGTGFFINPQYIITNEHVLHDGCARIVIQDRGRDWAPAQIVVTDTAHDLALLHTQAWPRDTAALRRDFDELKTGDRIVAVGFPLETLAKNKDYEVAEGKLVDPLQSFGNSGVLQFSHVIKLGYSGGPLLDGAGKVIGVVKAMAKIYETESVGGKLGKKKFVGEVDEAINLPTLEQFLMANNILYKTAPENESPGKGIDFTINVQCIDPAGEGIASGINNN